MELRLLSALAAVLVAAVAPASAAAQTRGFHAVTSRDGIDVWAVGDSGVVYRSFDRGVTWTSATLGVRSLRGVAARDLNVIVVGDSGKIWRSVNSGGAWSVAVAAGTPELRDVHWPAGGAVYAVGTGGVVLRSADGGGSWTSLPSGTAGNLNAVRFTDPSNGWVVGDAGTVLRTQDGGATWTPVATGAVHCLLAVDARGSAVWVVGERGTAFRSMDGGASWTPVDLKLDARSDVRAVWLHSPDSVTIAGGGGFIRRSGDRGAKWEFPVHGLQAQISDLHYVGPAGWAVSNRKRALVYTANGGATWFLPSGTGVTRTWDIKLPFAGSVRGSTVGLDGTHPNTFYCALGNGVYRSRDEGETWALFATIPQCTKVNAFIVSPKDSNVMVAAVSGAVPRRLVKSDDQGQTWFTTLERNFGEYGIPLEMDPDRPDTLYFGADFDGIYRSTDGGKNWARWSTTSFRSPCDIVVVPDSGNVILVGDGITGQGQGQYYKSIDWGQSFTLQETRPLGASEIPGMACTRLRNSTTFGTNWGSGGVQRSGDFGASWPNVHGAGAAWGVDVSRDDPNCVVFGVYSGGLGYVSLDGGTSFFATSLPGSNYSFFARDRGLILAEQSNGIYKLNVTYAYTPNNAQALVLVAPAGGESWPAESTRDIVWTSQNLALARIEYRRAPGEPWQLVAEVPGYANRHAWTVPGDATNQAMIRVRDAWDGSPADSSRSPFTITTAPMLVVEPADIEFPMTLVGTTPSRVISLANPGTGPVALTSISSDNPRFWPGRASLVIPAHGSDTLGVWYGPEADGPDAGSLTIVANDPSSPHVVSLSGVATTNVAVGGTAPAEFGLWQNRPNPFRGSTVIRYALPVAADVSLEVFDLQGQRVATLVRGPQGAGTHAVTFGRQSSSRASDRPASLASGVYFYRLRAGPFTSTRKMLHLE